MKLLPVMGHESLCLADKTWELEDGALAYRINLGRKVTSMFELVRVVLKPDYNSKPDEVHYDLRVLGTPSFFEGGLKIPEGEDATSAYTLSHSGDFLVRRTPETDILVRALLVLKGRLGHVRHERDVLERILTNQGKTKN